MNNIKKILSVFALSMLVLLSSGCKQNSDDNSDDYSAPVVRTFSTNNTINGDVYVEKITVLFYKNIYSFEKRTGVSYNTNYEIDVTASVNAYYSELATAMKDGGYVLAEVNSTGTKNGSSNSTTNCYRRDGNKYYLNSSIRYR